ncbi:MAG: hypothetical protein ACYCTI_01000 [Acidimicrobiales bacterium]
MSENGAPPITGSTPTSPSGATEASTAPTPAQPGTYYYRQSGTSTVGTTSQPVPAQGTMVVDAPSHNGSSQTWHRYFDTHQAPSDTVLAFGPSGVFITTEIERVDFGGQSTTITCNFAAPGIPTPPWPPAVGKSFTETGQCGTFSATVSGRITSQTTDTVGGDRLTVFVLQSNLVTHGQVQLTATETDWIAPNFRLPVHTQTQSHGTYGIASFSSNTTSDLVSLTPHT